MHLYAQLFYFVAVSFSLWMISEGQREPQTFGKKITVLVNLDLNILHLTHKGFKIRTRVLIGLWYGKSTTETARPPRPYAYRNNEKMIKPWAPSNDHYISKLARFVCVSSKAIDFTECHTLFNWLIIRSDIS